MERTLGPPGSGDPARRRSRPQGSDLQPASEPWARVSAVRTGVRPGSPNGCEVPGASMCRAVAPPPPTTARGRGGSGLAGLEGVPLLWGLAHAAGARPGSVLASCLPDPSAGVGAQLTPVGPLGPPQRFQVTTERLKGCAVVSWEAMTGGGGLQGWRLWPTGPAPRWGCHATSHRDRPPASVAFGTSSWVFCCSGLKASMTRRLEREESHVTRRR